MKQFGQVPGNLADGFSPIVKLIATMNKVTLFGLPTEAFVVEVNVTTYTSYLFEHANIVKDTDYELCVTAVNGAGQSSLGTTGNFRATNRPGQMVNVQAVTSLDAPTYAWPAFVSLNGNANYVLWNLPLNVSGEDVGSASRASQVTIKINNETKNVVTSVVVSAANMRSLTPALTLGTGVNAATYNWIYVDANALPGDKYSYKVFATNSYGDGVESPKSNSITAFASPLTQPFQFFSLKENPQNSNVFTGQMALKVTNPTSLRGGVPVLPTQGTITKVDDTYYSDTYVDGLKETDPITGENKLYKVMAFRVSLNVGTTLVNKVITFTQMPDESWQHYLDLKLVASATPLTGEVVVAYGTKVTASVWNVANTPNYNTPTVYFWSMSSTPAMLTRFKSPDAISLYVLNQIDENGSFLTFNSQNVIKCDFVTLTQSQFFGIPANTATYTLQLLNGTKLTDYVGLTTATLKHKEAMYMQATPRDVVCTVVVTCVNSETNETVSSRASTIKTINIFNSPGAVTDLQANLAYGANALSNKLNVSYRQQTLENLNNALSTSVKNTLYLYAGETTPMATKTDVTYNSDMTDGITNKQLTLLNKNYGQVLNLFVVSSYTATVSSINVALTAITSTDVTTRANYATIGTHYYGQPSKLAITTTRTTPSQIEFEFDDTDTIDNNMFEGSKIPVPYVSYKAVANTVDTNFPYVSKMVNGNLTQITPNMLQAGLASTSTPSNLILNKAYRSATLSDNASNASSFLVGNFIYWAMYAVGNIPQTAQSFNLMLTEPASNSIILNGVGIVPSATITGVPSIDTTDPASYTSYVMSTSIPIPVIETQTGDGFGTVAVSNPQDDFLLTINNDDGLSNAGPFGTFNTRKFAPANNNNPGAGIAALLSTFNTNGNLPIPTVPASNFSVTFANNALVVKVSDIIKGVLYDAKVSNVRLVQGYQASSASVSGTFSSSTAPGEVTNFKPTATSNTSITHGWEKPANTGGVPSTTLSYRVTITNPTTHTDYPSVVVPGTSPLSITINRADYADIPLLTHFQTRITTFYMFKGLPVESEEVFSRGYFGPTPVGVVGASVSNNLNTLVVTVPLPIPQHAQYPLTQISVSLLDMDDNLAASVTNITGNELNTLFRAQFTGLRYGSTYKVKLSHFSSEDIHPNRAVQLPADILLPPYTLIGAPQINTNPVFTGFVNDTLRITIAMNGGGDPTGFALTKAGSVFTLINIDSEKIRLYGVRSGSATTTLEANNILTLTIPAPGMTDAMVVACNQKGADHVTLPVAGSFFTDTYTL